jgi:malate/lactate dehydrogenase
MGRFKPGMRSLTLKDKVSRRYPRKVICSLTSIEHQKFQALALKLGVSMSDIMAYLITNHLDQLAHQASFEAGQQSALDNIANNPPENPTL